MPKYIMIYKSKKAVDVSEMPEEEVKKVMELWGEWLGNMGTHVVDEGDAFKFGGKSVGEDGVKDADNLLTGYGIIEVDNFDKALEYAAACPHIEDGGTVEVYEAFGL